MNDEQWKDIPGYEGRYQVSDLGRVRGPSGKVLKPQRINSGYLVVHLHPGAGVRRVALVHRLVAQAFVPNPSGKPTVNHIHPDGDKTRNTAGNLEWATNVEQMAHAKAVGIYDAAETPNRRAVVGVPVGGGAPVVYPSQIAAERDTWSRA